MPKPTRTRTKLASHPQRNANGRRGDHWVRSKGEAGTIAAALTVRVERTPFSESEQAAPPPQDEEGRHEGEL
jgi:biotin-(acetyl-CoA carboxylase) ligase